MGKQEERIARLAAADLDTLENATLVEGADPAREAFEGAQGDDDHKVPATTEDNVRKLRKDDPGIDITEEQARRIHQVVEDHTKEALSELTNLRDRADALMHAVRDADKEVKVVVEDYARKVAKAVKAKVLIARALEDIEKEFTAANPVITQRR